VVSFLQVSLPEPCAHISPSPIRATCPAHLILLDFTTRTILGTEYKSLRFSLCNFLYSPVASSLLGPNTLLNTQLSNIFSLRSSINVSDHVSHPYRTTGKIRVLYILIFKFLDSKLEDKRLHIILSENSNSNAEIWHQYWTTGAHHTQHIL
jgi:hypothetical protein